MAKRQKLDYNHQELTQHLKESVGQGFNAFFSPPSPLDENQPIKTENFDPEQRSGNHDLQDMPQLPAEDASIHDIAVPSLQDSPTSEEQRVGESRGNNSVSRPIDRPVVQSVGQSINQSINQSTNQSTKQLTGPSVDRPVAFYIPEIINKKIDEAVQYYQEKHNKKVDRSAVVSALLGDPETWTHEALDQLVDKVISQLTSRLTSRLTG